MSSSKELAEKSVHAAIAAIEIYNKPDFHFREEAFSLLMTNAWELLLKAKWLFDRSEDVASLYQYKEDPADANKQIVCLNRNNMPLTIGLTKLADKLFQESKSGIKKPCFDNILALVAIRDLSAHFINKDFNFGRRIQEVGTASLRNYVVLATEWFQIDLSRYNFYLMPLTFYHGFEVMFPASVSRYSDQMRSLISYLDSLSDAQPKGEVQPREQHFSLKLETHLVKKDSSDSVQFQWSKDPSVPAVHIREEDAFALFPWTQRDLIEVMKQRYSNFLVNGGFYRILKPLEFNEKLTMIRKLNPKNPKTGKQKFYSPNIVKEFDLHYKRVEKS